MSFVTVTFTSCDRAAGPTRSTDDLRFTVNGVGTASGAVLRLYVSATSPDAGRLHRIADNSCSESLLYADQPTLGRLITDVGGVTLDVYREI